MLTAVVIVTFNFSYEKSPVSVEIINGNVVRHLFFSKWVTCRKSLKTGLFEHLNETVTINWFFTTWVISRSISLTHLMCKLRVCKLCCIDPEDASFGKLLFRPIFSTKQTWFFMQRPINCGPLCDLTQILVINSITTTPSTISVRWGQCSALFQEVKPCHLHGDRKWMVKTFPYSKWKFISKNGHVSNVQNVIRTHQFGHLSKSQSRRQDRRQQFE